ncbi:sulfatase [Haloplanus rallus]|nr:sulfatase [Haloplanus rallus]
MSAPNILLISIDSLRSDFCSFLNDSERTMDFLDDLAGESTVFERAISPSTWTLPVHASVFTGLYPFEHGLNDGETILGDHPTLAEILVERGYTARSFTHNDWFRTSGMARGFDHEHTRMPGMVQHGFDNLRDGVRDRDSSSITKGTKQLLEAVPVKARKAFFRHRLKGARTVTKAIRRLKSDDAPFCHMVHLNDVHHAYRPHIDYYRKFGEEGLINLHKNVLYQQELKRKRDGIETGNYDIDEDRLELMIDLYRGSILQVDAQIERLVDSLIETGEYENTVIVVFGDHGDLLGERGRFGHGSPICDELVRVPLLIRDPTGQLEASRRSDPAQLNDLYPTLLKLIGESPPPTHSLPLQSDSRDAAFVHYRSGKLNQSSDALDFPESEFPPFKQAAIWKAPDSKLVYYPDEDRYRHDEEMNTDLLPELRAHLENLDPVPARGEKELSANVRSNLKQMGYL